MSDIRDLFDKAAEDRIVDAKDASTLLKDLTAEDWRKLAGEFTYTGALSPTRVRIEEKEDEFLVHNDKDSINDRKILDGVKAFGLAIAAPIAGYGVGAIAARFVERVPGPTLKFGAAALGLALGVWNYRSTMSGLEELEGSAFPLRIRKDSLPGVKTAMLDQSSVLNQTMLAAKPSQRLSMLKLG